MVLADELAVVKHDEFVAGELPPCFVVGEGQGGDDGYTVVGSGYLGEVYCHVFVNQVGLPKRGLAGDVVEQGAGVGIHHTPVG